MHVLFGSLHDSVLDAGQIIQASLSKYDMEYKHLHHVQSYTYKDEETFAHTYNTI